MISETGADGDRPMAAEAIQQAALAELRRAALFKLLALTVTDPAKAGALRVQRAFAMLPDANPMPLHFGREVYEPARQAWAKADAPALEAEYDRLFRRNLACPPHETSYGDGRRMGGRPAELADIRGFYEAFGVAPSSGDPNLPDHLAAELEFYAILRLKSAHARCEADAERLEVTSEAAASFLEDHLGRWPRAFREAVEAEGAASPYLESAKLIEAAVSAECRRVGVRPRLAESSAAPDPTTSEDVLTCPMASDCGKRAVR
jgi:TorA maturation chaperone TorD